MGGCFAESSRRIDGDDASAAERDYTYVYRLARSTIYSIRQDPRVKDAVKGWAACMADQGYRYKAPWDPLEDPRWNLSNTITETERKTAVADQECRARVNYVGISYFVDHQAQAALVERQAPALNEVRQRNLDRVERANAVLAGG